MRLQMLSKIFPFGSHLCREPMPPMSELKRDMENLKRHGFNIVKLQEHWMIDEPQEEHYDFSRYEELIEHAAKLELLVYLGLTCEQAPPWLWRKYPDCRMIDINGIPISYEAQSTLLSDGKPGPCFDHPGVRADQARFITKLVQTLGRYEHIIWNIFQEIGYGEECICYCENTLTFFREWLQTKYGDLDGLNRAWNTRFLDWNYITPERRHKLWTAIEIDWRYFIDNVRMACVLQTRTETIKQADPFQRPVFAHTHSHPNFASGQDWASARCLDFLGSSCYPGWSGLQSWDDHYPPIGKSFDK